MARIRVILFFLAFIACEDSAPPSLGEASADAGSPPEVSDGGPPDLLAPDAEPAPPDAGQPADMGPRPDLGPPIRSVEVRPLLTPAEIDNHVLLPDFDDQVVNGGWIGLDLESGQVRDWLRRTRWDAPSDRREMAVLPRGEGVGLYGFGVVPPGDVEGSVWLGMEGATDADWESLVAGLIVYAPSLGPALVIFQPSGEVVERGGLEWRRHGASAGTEIVGRVTVGVQSPGTQTVWINGPHLRAFPLDPGGRRRSNPAPLSEAPRWSEAAEALARPRPRRPLLPLY